jgi:hypothetical protein
VAFELMMLRPYMAKFELHHVSSSETVHEPSEGCNRKIDQSEVAKGDFQETSKDSTGDVRSYSRTRHRRSACGGKFCDSDCAIFTRQHAHIGWCRAEATNEAANLPGDDDGDEGTPPNWNRFIPFILCLGRGFFSLQHTLRTWT